MPLPSSYDIIGNRDKAIAIVELPKGWKGSRKTAAEAIMARHKNVKSVLLKAGPRRGVYRKRKYRLLAGEKNTEVMHAESGCKFLLDPRKVYFSPREGTERARVAAMVKEDERIAVFFAGIGPYAILIAKKSRAAKVVGIEINPAAVRYFKKNVKLNKVQKLVEVMKGDVKKVVKSKGKGAFDRIVMPLPENAFCFLREAALCAKRGAIVHYYCILKEGEEMREKARVERQMKSYGRKIKFLGVQRVLPWGPRIWKMRMDFISLPSPL